MSRRTHEKVAVLVDSARHQVAARRCSRLMPIMMAVLLVATDCLYPVGVSIAQAQRLVQIGAVKRTTMVSVPVGKSEDVRTSASFTEIVVGDPDVADVNPLTDHSLSILGKKNGTTRVSVYAEGKKLVGVFDVEVSYDTSMLAGTIARRFPNAGLKVSSVNGRIMLSGTSPDAPTVDKAVTIAKQFGPEVINSVQILQAQQVMLEVRFVEVNRQAGRDLGVQWNTFSNNGRYLANIGNRTGSAQLPITPTGTNFHQPGVTSGGQNLNATDLPISPIVAAGVLSGTAPFGFLVGKLIASGLTADVMINALEQKGLARSLAEPNLVALSGDTASFLAGGEYPVPVPGALGTVSIEYKRYGVGLAFTPTVLGDGLINMKIEPEVSELDRSNPVQVAGIAVPPLIVRRASTTVELRDGQSFVIGGLLQSQGKTAQQQLPWLGDIPILGALFRSASYQKNETDLAIIVTPRLVRPARPGDSIRTPLDNTLPPNDVDLFMMGKPEITPAMARIAAGGANRVFTGHVLDLPKGGHIDVVSVKN
ncbi:MAG: type II and III secretion system protein family protein [Rhizobiales bacterium]|nr:type II and III secretion system protein family protein [Hyphomicrobiales bacterium]